MTPQDVFEQIEQELGAGMVPQIFLLLESRPALLIHLWGQFRTIVLEGELPRVLKEMVGLVIASITHCAYVRVVHLHNLSLQGVDAELLQSLRAGDFHLAGVSDLTEQALRFTVLSASTRSAYGDPHLWPGMRQASLELLATMPLEDSEKIELVATIALFEQVCSVANLLDLDPNQP